MSEVDTLENEGKRTVVSLLAIWELAGIGLKSTSRVSPASDTLVDGSSLHRLLETASLLKAWPYGDLKCNLAYTISLACSTALEFIDTQHSARDSNVMSKQPGATYSWFSLALKALEEGGDASAKDFDHLLHRLGEELRLDIHAVSVEKSKFIRVNREPTGE